MKNLFGKICWAISIIALFSIAFGCDPDINSSTNEGVCLEPNPDNIGIISNDSIPPYTGDVIWSSVPKVDSFCFSFIVKNAFGETVLVDTIVPDTFYSFNNYELEIGDSIILCVSSFCNGVCADPPLKDTIIFGNGLAEDNIVFMVPPESPTANEMCSANYTCDLIYFMGESVTYNGTTFDLGNYYQNYYFYRPEFCQTLQTNGDDLMDAINTSSKTWRTFNLATCN